MNYKFIIDNIVLPITPKEIKTKINNKNSTIDIINLGEVNILKLPGLNTFEFDFVAPAFNYHFVSDFKEQNFYYSWLEKLKTEKKIFPFSISRQFPDGSIKYPTIANVSLEEYSILESSDEGFDIVFSVILKQYKYFHTQYIQINNSNNGDKIVQQKKQREYTKEPEKTYTVKKGDTLWNIAKKELNDGTKYTDIAKLNNIENPNKIYPGQILKLN